MPSNTSSNNLSNWIELIRHQEMPLFDQTVHQVLHVSHDELSSASSLAKVVMQDASLTGRVLKLANSVYYNPAGASAGGAIATVSRAIIVLGFNAVSNMCLTATLVDAVLDEATRKRVAGELAHGLHAAIQARSLATERRDKSAEEIFIAALLHRVGELAFWCFGGDQIQALEKLYRQPGMTPERAQKQLLGFQFETLSAQLAHEWNLTDLQRAAIINPQSQDVRVHNVMLGQQIADCAERSGWHNETMEALIEQAAKLIDASPEKTRRLIFRNAQDSAELARDIGAHLALPFIPDPDAEGADQTEAHQHVTAEALKASPNYPQPDAKVQLQILRELSSQCGEGQADLNRIMELTLDGIYRGVGMDRVVFALSSPDNYTLKARHALGSGCAQLLTQFHFTRISDQRHPLFESIERQQALYLDSDKLQRARSSIPRAMIQILGLTPFMIAPVTVADRCIGLLYADRAPSERPLNAELFQDFKHFAEQASSGLTLVAKRNRR